MRVYHWFLLSVLSLLMAPRLLAQRATTTFAVTQQDQRLHIGMEYQIEDNNILGAFSQDYRITVQNKTSDKLHVYIEYYAETVCGKRRTSQFAPLGDGYILQGGESVNPTNSHKTFGYQRLLGDECPKNTWRQTGVDKNGDKTYSIIKSLGYRILKVVNISEQERIVAAEKKKKEEEEKKRKLVEAVKKSESQANGGAPANSTKTATTNKVANSDFWSDRKSSSTATPASTTNSNDTKSTVAQSNGIRTASQFKGGLGDIKEGGYFKDDQGNYFRKENGVARKVDKSTYDRARQKEIEVANVQREARVEAVSNAVMQTGQIIAASFYSKQLTNNLRDASSLYGDFNSVEELNEAFQQQLHEISQTANELKAVSVANVQAYASATGTGSGYDYSGITSAVGTIAAVISSNKAEKEAREELQRQRNAEEARIKKEQLDALVGVRTKIAKLFIEGGMPLSAHKVTAPVLYMFAYASDKSIWNTDQSVPMHISNVIPLYRYSDGTYPYTANVKQKFEHAGMNHPILMGYFTDKQEAEKYRRSLINAASSGQFTIKEVGVTVKDQVVSNSKSQNPETDFWGRGTTGKNTGEKIEMDFWGRPIKSNTSEVKKKTTTTHTGNKR